VTNRNGSKRRGREELASRGVDMADAMEADLPSVELTSPQPWPRLLSAVSADEDSRAGRQADGERRERRERRNKLNSGYHTDLAWTHHAW
jgi:hypothetical protein